MLGSKRPQKSLTSVVSAKFLFTQRYRDRKRHKLAGVAEGGNIDCWKFKSLSEVKDIVCNVYEDRFVSELVNGNLKLKFDHFVNF